MGTVFINDTWGVLGNDRIMQYKCFYSMGRTKESATESLQPHEMGKLMASGIDDFKSREGSCPVNITQQRSRRDGVMELGKGCKIFFNNWIVRISSP